MATNDYCDGVRRRDFLRLGVLGRDRPEPARLPPDGRGRRGGRPARRPRRSSSTWAAARRTWTRSTSSPTPPREFRGEFKPIATNVPGRRDLRAPAQARPVRRQVRDPPGGQPQPGGARVRHQVHEHGQPADPVAGVPRLRPGGDQGEGRPARPPAVRGDPRHAAGGRLPRRRVRPVQHHQPSPRPASRSRSGGSPSGNGLTVEEVEKRRDLLKTLDSTFRGFEKDSDLVNGLDRFSQRAYDIISSPRSRAGVRHQPGEARGRQARSATAPIGQSCLLATRLVESGVRFVTLSSGGWDTHDDNFEQAQDPAPARPRRSAVAGLFTALDRKGLLETTAVFVTGEFGRTPKINPRAGRDHFPRAMCVLMGGGGIKGGQVIGASDDKAMGPASGDGITPDDVAASFYHALGIDCRKEYKTNTGRPIAIVRNGKPIPELFA